jgi:ABC-type transport system involved in cytochrome c biogenesis ATPase subunit
MNASSPPPRWRGIRLSDVSVRRGPNRIVEGLSLDIGAGRICWITGPNGAGKSSLLRVIAGLDAPETGTVLCSGPEARRGYFHSEMGIPGPARVGDWSRLVTRLLEVSAGTDRPAPPPTPLWPDVEPARRIGRLSTGERKRLLLDPLLRQAGSLVLDEPFAHLSAGARSTLLRLLRERARRTVVVVASHRAADRAAGEGWLHLEGGLARRQPTARGTS